MRVGVHQIHLIQLVGVFPPGFRAMQIIVVDLGIGVVQLIVKPVATLPRMIERSAPAILIITLALRAESACIR